MTTTFATNNSEKQVYIVPSTTITEVELADFITTSVNVYGDAVEGATGLARPINFSLWEEEEITNSPQENNEDDFDDFEDEEEA